MTAQRKRGRPARKPKTVERNACNKKRDDSAFTASMPLAPKNIIDLEHRAGEPRPLGDVRGGCCWIHPAPPKRMFCGHPAVDGTWCEHHINRVYPTHVLRSIGI